MSYSYAVLNRRIIGLLAIVLALGAASVASAPRAGFGEENTPVASLLQQQCEQVQTPLGKHVTSSGALPPDTSFHRTPKIQRLRWSASFPRPPTRLPLAPQ